jgi:hypothetical protein
MQLANIFKSDEKIASDESVSLCHQLLEKEASWPQVEAEICIIGRKYAELNPKLADLETAEKLFQVRLPETQILKDDLTALLKLGKSQKAVYDRQLDEIRNRLKNSNKNIRAELAAEFRALPSNSSNLRRTHRLNSFRAWRGEAEITQVEIETNLDVLDQRRSLALAAAQAIQEMEYFSIPEITAAAEEWMEKISAVNVRKMITETVPLSLANEMEGKGRSKDDSTSDRLVLLENKISKMEQKQ